jgi:hypothetical protein
MTAPRLTTEEKLGGRQGSKRKLQYKMGAEARVTLFMGDMGEGALHREDEVTVKQRN